MCGRARAVGLARSLQVSGVVGVRCVWEREQMCVAESCLSSAMHAVDIVGGRAGDGEGEGNRPGGKAVCGVCARGGAIEISNHGGAARRATETDC